MSSSLLERLAFHQEGWLFAGELRDQVNKWTDDWMGGQLDWQAGFSVKSQNGRDQAVGFLVVSSLTLSASGGSTLEAPKASLTWVWILSVGTMFLQEGVWGVGIECRY